MQLTLFPPETTWTVPTELPDLRQCEYIGVDTETVDPNLQAMGPGFIRGDAYVAGISLASERGHKLYLPIGHKDGNDMDPTRVINYVTDMLSVRDAKYCGANLTYDMDALKTLGIEIEGKLCDIQIAGPLIDEERPGGYSLDALAEAYLNDRKDTSKLDDALLAHGLKKKSKGVWVPDRGGIGKLPSRYVGDYAEHDAVLPINIFQMQEQELEEQNLEPVFELEQELQRVLWRMHQRGVRVDVDKALQLIPGIVEKEDALLTELREMSGLKVDPYSSKSMKILFDKFGIWYPVTGNGNPSFTADFLTGIADEHPVTQKIVDYRKLQKMRQDFIYGVVVEQSVDSRLHPQWHQVRAPREGDSGESASGIRGGRIGATQPNLTQIPSRHPYWGPLIRGLFIPEPGETWCKCDYSQQEPRIGLHFAYLMEIAGTYGIRGAAAALERYIQNPNLDYHQLVADLISSVTGLPFERNPAKTINLGLGYGMGLPKLALKLGVSVEEAAQIMHSYHEGVPYVKQVADIADQRAQARGFVTTFLGRRRRYQDWEPNYRTKKYQGTTRDYDQAIEWWGKGIRRANTHKAWNAIVQGSAADQTKTAIVNLSRKGFLPTIQVYDELNGSISDMEQARMMEHEMEYALPFKTPFSVEAQTGVSWGELS